MRLRDVVNLHGDPVEELLPRASVLRPMRPPVPVDVTAIYEGGWIAAGMRPASPGCQVMRGFGVSRYESLRLSA